MFKAAIASFTLAALTHLSAMADNTQQASSYEAVFSNLALSCIHKEYSNKISHFINSDDDIKPPRELYPAFYGCFDWHSSVHGHWLLVRMLNTASDKVDVETITVKLNQSFTANNMMRELANYSREGMHSFQRPYGIAWLLQLTAELRQSSHPQAQRWLNNIMPLEQKAVANISDWLPKLTFPIRTGEHSQTAFAFGLMLDWSRIAKDKAFESLLTSRVIELYADDVDCPLEYEPSGHDFLSPCIAQADLMRRVMDKITYAAWLSRFFPNLTETSDANWLAPGVVTDKTDGKLAHLDGLNTSRAWMLEGIISGLPADDERISALQMAVETHRIVGLNAVLGDMHYMGSHWLGSYAAYLQTRRGIQ